MIANNASGLDAGGISLPGGTVINSTFYNNTATERGGGILVRITDIDADMGGVQSVPFNLQNSILVGNTATTAGNAIYLVDAVAPLDVTEIEATIDYNLIGGGEADLGVGTFDVSYTDLPLSDATNVALSNTIEESDASAVFVSIMAADDDFLRLKDGSPAVNAGNDAHIPGILTDAAGDTRIQRGMVDLGAYESALVPSTVQAITFTTPATDITGEVGDVVPLIATTNAAGLNVSFAITTTPGTGVARLTDNGSTDGIGSLTIDGIGTVTVTASQTGGVSGSTNYAAATDVVRTITVVTIRRVVASPIGGTQDGSSWANAMTLEAALAAPTMAGDQIWIAAGTYKPVMPVGATPTAEERKTTFNIPAGVSVYGGFAGTETVLSVRANTAPTILSGDLIGNDEVRFMIPTVSSRAAYEASRTDNSHTVVTITGADVTLDGLTITAGEGGTLGPLNFFSFGAGLYAGSSTAGTVVRNCMFTNNAGNDAHRVGEDFTIYFGGGAYFTENATLIGCAFTGNIASLGGGAYFNQTTTLTNCTFTGNEASTEAGGANFAREANLTNCVVANNTSDFNAGGILLPGGTVINSTFYNNTATSRGGGIMVIVTDIDMDMAGVQSVPFNLQNSILVGNTATTAGNAIYLLDNFAPIDVTDIEATIDYNLIGGGEADLGVGTFFNFSYTDLLLFDATNVALSNTIEESDAGVVFASIMAADDDFLRLKVGSPAINAGNDAHIPDGILTDAADDTRIQMGMVDLGAYESALVPSTVQDITFTAPATDITKTVGGVVPLMATTNAPGFNVSFTIMPATGVATLVDNRDGTGMLTLTGEGTVTVTASQTGGDIGGTLYAAATDVTRTITVLRETLIFRVTEAGAAKGTDGSNWTTEAMSLQAALVAAIVPGDQVWIAQGTYKPHHADDRTATFAIQEGVRAYGGFMGDEATDFDPETTARMGAATILSGDLSGDDLTDRRDAGYADSRDDNSNTVVTITGADVTLDGLTITAGEGGTYLRHGNGGAGLLAGNSAADAVVRNCMFTNNEISGGSGAGAYFANNITLMGCAFTGNKAGIGGGVYFSNAGITATLTNCTFTGNIADSGGGAFFDRQTTNTLTNCTFTGNTVTGFGGGANIEGEVKIINCVFANNRGDSGGGGIFSSYGTTIINSTFYLNTVTGGNGGGIRVIFLDDNPFTLQNSILVGNTAPSADNGNQVYFLNTTRDEINIQNNLIAEGADPNPSDGTDQGVGYNDPGSLLITVADIEEESDASVVFVSTDIINPNFLRLAAGSPALNAGNDDHVNNATPRIITDAAGNARIKDGTVDLGAYEGVFAPLTAQNITFADPTGGATVRVGETIDLVATTDAPSAAALPITFTSSVTDVAVVVPNMNGTFSLRLDGAGDVTITATQAGGVGADGVTYAPATATQTITVSKGMQTIRFTSDGAGVVGSTITLAATATSTLPVTFEIESQTPSGVATLDTDTGVLTLIAAGDVVITATQSGDANYEAAPEVMQTIVVSATPLTPQTIMFSPSMTGTVGTDIVLAATATSTLPVTFAIESQTPTMGGSTVATLVGGNTLMLTGAGTVTITARQSGGRDGATVYAPAEVMQTITVGQGTQTITFSSDDTGVAGSTIELMATASTGLTPVTFAITAGDSFATLASNGTTLSLTGAGIVTITATQAGNANYAEATQTQDITISDPVLGIEDVVDNFVLYPNPTSGTLHFSERVEEFRLYGIEGRLLETQKNVRSADLAAWPVGLYFAEVIRGGQRTRYRIIRK